MFIGLSFRLYYYCYLVVGEDDFDEKHGFDLKEKMKKKKKMF